MLLFINQIGVREKISGKALIAFFNCDKLQNQNALLLRSKCAMKHMQKHKHTHQCSKKIDIRRQRRLQSAKDHNNGLRVKQYPGKLNSNFKFYE